MSASLVGSEMCIRDSPRAGQGRRPEPGSKPGAAVRRPGDPPGSRWHVGGRRSPQASTTPRPPPGTRPKGVP
eukprot:15292868-Alexandrium_andersonii.AAC.1